MLEDPKVLVFGKTLVGVMWLLCLAFLILPGESSLLAAGRMTFWLTAAAHLVECAIFLPILRASQHGLPGNLAQTMLFGVFHYASVKLELADSTAEGGAVD